MQIREPWFGASKEIADNGVVRIDENGVCTVDGTGRERRHALTAAMERDRSRV